MQVKDETPLPLYGVFRKVDHDETTDNLILSASTPYPATVIDDLHCYPLFTSRERATALMQNCGVAGAVVECDVLRLLKIITTLLPPGVTFDPGAIGEVSPTYETNSFVKWLLDKAEA
ncbi:MAG: hypothetical protein SH850_15540 [Planctomycetaceae bacterium]|nr:hypothetical protein [Planctomycetaceae bacterium]